MPKQQQVQYPRYKLATLIVAIGFASLVQLGAGLAQAAEPSLPYTVRPRDKLIVLNKELLNAPTAWAEIAKLNGLKDPNVIRPGQVLNIPLRLLRPQRLQANVLSATGDVSSVQGSTLAEGTQIKVGANSSAVIELADKSKVKLLPGTLAEVVQNRHYGMRDAASSISTNWFSGTVRVIQGAIEVFAEKTGSRATPLEVMLPTAVVGVRGTVFRAAHEGNLSRTEVLEGKVRADNPAQASGGDVPAGFGAVIDPKVKEVKAVALLSAPDLSGAAAQTNLPTANWAFPAVAGALSYRIQVATDADFNAVVRDIKAPQPRVDLASLGQGAWFVRVRGVDAIGLEGFSAAKRVSIDAPVAVVAPAPVPLLPLFAPQIATRASLSLRDGMVTMRLPELDKNYSQLQGVVAKDAAIQQVLQTSPLTGQTWSLGKLGVGTYYFQFKGVDSLGRANQSPVYKLSLDENWGQTVFDVTGALQLNLAK